MYEEPQYTHYEIQKKTTPEEADFTPRWKQEGYERRKKKKSFALRLLQTLILAIVFGTVSAIAFFFVLSLTQKSTILLPEEKPAVEETPSVFQTDEPANSATLDPTLLNQLLEERGTVSSVAETAMPSVVAITSVSIQEIPNFFGFGFGYGYREYPKTGSGSGIIVGENENELLIATNNHVIEGAQTLSVCFIGDDVSDAEQTLNTASGDGDINVEHAVSAKIKGTAPEDDLAVIAVQKSDIPSDTMARIKIARIGNSEDMVIGSQVVAIGNALGYGQSVTSGWISAFNRSVTTKEGSGTGLIQTDAAINPGNSGGALLNMNGELIGINSAKYADENVEGMGYAIPISKALPILEELMNRKTREIVSEEKAAYLGVQAASLTREAVIMYNMPNGAFLVEVTEGAAADRAGLRKGDIITKLDGQKISGREDLIDLLPYYEAGETVEVVLERATEGYYEEHTISVTFDHR